MTVTIIKKPAQAAVASTPKSDTPALETKHGTDPPDAKPTNKLHIIPGDGTSKLKVPNPDTVYDEDLPKPYAVGHKKPPKQHQFKKGVSGNPSGRPKKVKTLLEMITAEAYSAIQITEGGEKKKVAKMAAVIKRLFDKAIATGHPAALKLALELSELASESAQQKVLEDPHAAGKFIEGFADWLNKKAIDDAGHK